MPTRGTVVRLQLGRSIGKVMVRNFILVPVSEKVVLVQAGEGPSDQIIVVGEGGLTPEEVGTGVVLTREGEGPSDQIIVVGEGDLALEQVTTEPMLVEEPVYHAFVLYSDGDATMIDPTEMVRRNWLIGLLQRALADTLEVTILHHDDDHRVRGVVLHAAE
jgi:hypothetical protein